MSTGGFNPFQPLDLPNQYLDKDEMNISLLIAVKNNLEYTKYFYETTRAIYPDVELCFASYGSTDGTHDYLFGLLVDDKNVKFQCSSQQKTFSDTYNLALSMATKDYVVYVHNDIVLTSNFCENILKHANERSIISYTTIEPPIFEGHSRPGKLIYEFGRDNRTLDIDKLYEYSKKLQIDNENKTEAGVGFFMCMPRTLLLSMGGLDNLFNPMFCEDDDLILRFKLKGLELKTSLDAICYHFVSKTSRFSEEFKDRTNQIELNSNRNFIRKWGFRNSILNKKLDIGLVITNCQPIYINIYEPWFNNIHVDIPFNQYIEDEQKLTSIDLKSRIKNITDPITNNVIIRCDGNNILTDKSWFFAKMHDVIFNNGEIGSFRYDIFNIEVKSLDSYEHLLINKVN